MNDEEKIYTPEVIQDEPLPNQVETPPPASSPAATNEIYRPSTTQDQVFPAKRIAQEVMASALNTRSKKILQSFQFTPSGAIQIGNYAQGVNGDIRISPIGIIGRNLLGDTTFALDAETGDAVFSGTVTGESLVAGNLFVGDGNIQIDGDNRRLLFFDSNGIPVIVIGNVS